MFISPQTINSQIVDAIGELVTPGVFLPIDDPRMMDISTEITKLSWVSPNEAKIASAMMSHLSGDLETALKILDTVTIDTTVPRMCILLNFSKAREAQVVYRENCSPSSGHFTSCLRFGFATGSVHKSAQFLREAEAMQLAGIDKRFADEVIMAEDILSEYGVSDEDIAPLIETAGSVLTDAGFMFVGEGPCVDVFNIQDELRAVHYTYKLPVSAQTALELYLEFIARMVEKGQVLPMGFHIAFCGVGR